MHGTEYFLASASYPTPLPFHGHGYPASRILNYRAQRMLFRHSYCNQVEFTHKNQCSRLQFKRHSVQYCFGNMLEIVTFERINRVIELQEPVTNARRS